MKANEPAEYTKSAMKSANVLPPIVATQKMLHALPPDGPLAAERAPPGVSE